MILEIDIGNTFAKWRVRSNESVLACGKALSAQLLNEFELFFSELQGHSLSDVWISSVVASSHNQLRKDIEQYFGVVPIFAETEKTCAGVTNAYSCVEQLGVDRWLALIAAFNKGYGDVLIVDAGSAVTVDILCADGIHQGGYIAPGLNLMRQALFKTDQVNISSVVYPESLLPGRSTEAAVLSALPSMVLGLIAQAYQQLIDEAGCLPSVLLTGGDAEYLAGRLQFAAYDSIILDESLVLDGLAFSIFGKSKQV